MPRSRAPGIELDGVRVGRLVELSVEAPSRKQLGGSVTFRVIVRNAGNEPAESLVIHSRFDEALDFTGIDQHEVLQSIERLLPGESKELALTLSAREVGSHCCEFRMTAGDADREVELARKTVCVEFVTRVLDVELVGPDERTQGSRAEFTLSLWNRSVRAISDVRAHIAYDQAIVPRESSARAERRPGSLSWHLGLLKPMESVQFQVEFDCRSIARRACVAAEITAHGLTAEHSEACLEIAPVPGTLDLRVGDRTDPLEVGQKGEFEVSIRNIGLQPARGVALEVGASEHLRVVSAFVRLDDEPLQLQYDERDARLVFDPVDELAPNGRLTFRIEVEARRPGTAELRASLSSALRGSPVTAAEPTVVTE